MSSTAPSYDLFGQKFTPSDNLYQYNEIRQLIYEIAAANAPNHEAGYNSFSSIEELIEGTEQVFYRAVTEIAKTCVENL